MSGLDLVAIRKRAEAATPGPWYVRLLDDDWAMNLTAVSTQPGADGHEQWPEFDESTMVAATLVQHPRYVDVTDEHWDENADFIAHARQDIPALVAEVEGLRKRVADLEGPSVAAVYGFESGYAAAKADHEKADKLITELVKAAMDLSDGEDAANPKAVAIYVPLETWQRFEAAVAVYQAEGLE